ncbi:MAG: outer membrane beta-barrel protein [Ignavibacteriae bacterium]|nr:outer membrane beta-barrel protein [Ignavibacteriota bacterium]
MKKSLVVGMFIIMLFSHATYSQMPGVSSPVKFDLGVGGGVSLPTGKLSDASKTGYHVGAKIRLHSFIPLSIVSSGYYNRLPEKNTDKTDSQWMLGVGLEYPIPSVMVKPYFGADALVNIFKNEGTGTSSYTRGGVGLGAGVEFSIPAFGSFDTSLKYQIFNVVGKEDGEETFSQIAASVALMVSLL